MTDGIIARDRMVEAVALLGLDAHNLKSVAIECDKITAIEFVRDEHGHMFVDHSPCSGDQHYCDGFAKRTVTIQVL